MWGFAHLHELPGAGLVTTASQKGQSVQVEHNVAHVFEKARRLVASVRLADPSVDRSHAMHFHHAEIERI